MPLCARCSGIFLGSLLGLAYQIPQGRRAHFPARRFAVVLGLFALAFAVDGFNSFLNLIPGAPGLYEPGNVLRLLTGTGVGLSIALVLYPLYQQTVWQRWQDQPPLASWKQFGTLLLGAAALIALVLSDQPLVLYALALLSAGTVLLLLGLCYTLLWIIITRTENTYAHPGQLWPPLIGGFTIALLQVAAIDAARFALTGTWGGLPLP